MDINEEIKQMVTDGEIPTLWKHFRLLYHEGEIDKDTFHKAKYGVKIIFDIREYIKTTYEDRKTGIYMRDKDKMVEIDDNIYEMEDFDDEIDEREDIMRKCIIEHYEEGEQTIPNLT